jgi:hypothetical protein
VFVADLAAMKADDGIPQTVAPIEEVQLYTRDWRQANLRHVPRARRSDERRDSHARRSASGPRSRRQIF